MLIDLFMEALRRSKILTTCSSFKSLAPNNQKCVCSNLYIIIIRGFPLVVPRPDNFLSPPTFSLE